MRHRHCVHECASLCAYVCAQECGLSNQKKEEEKEKEEKKEEKKKKKRGRCVAQTKVNSARERKKRQQIRIEPVEMHSANNNRTMK